MRCAECECVAVANTDTTPALCLFCAWASRYVTFRTVIRIMRSAAILPRNGRSDAQQLLAAFRVMVTGQLLNRPRVAVDLGHCFGNALGLSDELTDVALSLKATTSDDVEVAGGNHVLTRSRQRYRDNVLDCVQCGFPVLLEGPAAVGKTSLIRAMCPEGTCCEQVNNTDTTTVQDYLGSIVPQVGLLHVSANFACCPTTRVHGIANTHGARCTNTQGNVCVVQYGALYRAVKRGYWFVADEFNLADPAVMSMLFPLLEGRPVFVSPVTGETIQVHPKFRFFATQVCELWLHLHHALSTT